MNGIHVDIEKLAGIEGESNIFELRHRIFRRLITKVHEHIDYLYDLLAGDKKIDEIGRRTIKSQINKESLTYLYKGVEIPLMGKTGIILDNISYIPIFQMIDKPIHLQKDGRYVVVKNNVRNTFLKLDGKVCNVLYKNASIPLLPYLLYVYDSVREMLTDFGYTIIDIDSNPDIDVTQCYIVPEYYDNRFLVVKHDFEDGGWKEFFLSPYMYDRFEFHQQIYNIFIDQINTNIIPQIHDEYGNLKNMQDIVETSEIDQQLQENKERRKRVTRKQAREYILIRHNKNQAIIDKIFNIISVYHAQTRTTKTSLTKMYLESSLFKFMSKDITMDNISLFDMIIDCVRSDMPISPYYNINDISQKNIRFLEWYAMKLSSVSAYPDQSLIMDVAKIEPKRVYDNSVNPIAELSMCSRVNFFGAGALPKEGCGPSIRNNHSSYLGILDCADTPSGVNVGISMHLCPEVQSEDMGREVRRLHDDNVIMRLYNKDTRDIGA